MPQYNVNLTEQLAVLGQLTSGAKTTTGGIGSGATYAIGPFDSYGLERILFLVNLGTLGSSGTVDLKVQSCSTSNGTFADVGSVASAQVLQGTATTPTTTVMALEVKAETLAANSAARYIQGLLTIGTATSTLGALALGTYQYGPAADATNSGGTAGVTPATAPTGTVSMGGVAIKVF